MSSLARLPDTINLPARALLALNAIDSLRDEKKGGQIYFYIRLNEDPPTAYHSPWDYGDGTGRYIDALTLMHLMTGSQRAIEVAHEMVELLLSWQGDKGLFWWPIENWTVPGPSSTGLWRFVANPRLDEHHAELAWSPRGALMGLTTLHLHTGEQRFADAARKLIDGLNEIALKKDDYRYIPEMVYRKSGWGNTDEPISDGTSELKNGSNILPMLRFYEATGYTPALELAEGLLRFILHRAEGYEIDASFYKTNGHWNHFHSKSTVIIAAIRYGLLTRKPEFVAWGRQAYEAAKKWGTDFGWYPEDLLAPTACELCCTSDMIEAALLLAQHVDPNYYGEVEIYGRNHVVESQFLDTEWRSRIPRRPAWTDAVRAGPGRTCQHNILQRSLGSFSGFSGPHDLFGDTVDFRLKLMQCCTGAGVRALYNLWHYAVEDDGHRAKVNMSFSRPTVWADIINHAPYTGRLDIRMKSARSVGVRIPQWVCPSAVRVTVNANDVTPRLQGSYAWLDDLKAGDAVTICHDLPLRSQSYLRGEVTYVAQYKGDTAISMHAKGPIAPIYQRDHYLQNTAPEVDQLWYLPSREIPSL